MKSPEPIVEYTRSGGFAAFEDRLAIDRDGNATVARRDRSRAYRPRAETIAELTDALDKARFTELDKEYRGRGADLFTYIIRYKGHTVTAMDGAVPRPLEDVIRRLNGMVDDSGLGPR